MYGDEWRRNEWWNFMIMPDTLAARFLCFHIFRDSPRHVILGSTDTATFGISSKLFPFFTSQSPHHSHWFPKPRTCQNHWLQSMRTTCMWCFTFAPRLLLACENVISILLISFLEYQTHLAPSSLPLTFSPNIHSSTTVPTRCQ